MQGDEAAVAGGISLSSLQMMRFDGRENRLMRRHQRFYTPVRRSEPAPCHALVELVSRTGDVASSGSLLLSLSPVDWISQRGSGHLTRKLNLIIYHFFKLRARLVHIF